MVSRHPSAEWLVEYSSGSLSPAQAIATTTHIKFCSTCETMVDSLAHLGGTLLQECDSVPISKGLLDHVLTSIETDFAPAEPKSELPAKVVDGIAAALPQYVRNFLPAGDLRWSFLSPSLRLATIGVGEAEFELALHRIKAGGQAPEHDHGGQEITVVLTGCFSDEEGIYQPGDFMVRDAGDIHKPIAAQNEECICLSVLAAPIKLTGFKRLLNPLLKFSPG